MKKSILVFIISLWVSLGLAQTKEGVFQLNDIDNLLTKDVKTIIDKDIDDKRIVFLGESQHNVGSDLLAKTEFVKYLVKEHNYKNIVFESDFFGLYFEHSKDNLFGIWSNSEQCDELFDFLENNNVTIWGFDNQLNGPYVYYNFAKKFKATLLENNILFEPRLIELSHLVAKNKDKFEKYVTKKDIDYLITQIDTILLNDNFRKNLFWFQALKSFKTSIELFQSSRKKSIVIRDTQMADNLDFLVKQNPETKFLVWLANTHMSKCNLESMKGKTMGYQFEKMNPNISYRIATSPIKMPYLKDKQIKKWRESENHILNLLPDIEHNFLIDSKVFLESYPQYINKEFEGMFNVGGNSTNYFKHFDLLVFIAEGEKSIMKKWKKK